MEGGLKAATPQRQLRDPTGRCQHRCWHVPNNWLLVEREMDVSELVSLSSRQKNAWFCGSFGYWGLSILIILLLLIFQFCEKWEFSLVKGWRVFFVCLVIKNNCSFFIIENIIVSILHQSSTIVYHRSSFLI